ncbi:ATP-binding protein [Streptomyces sp. NPDC093252]|uniref:ATP-binding protein n=1 Tax=Streptomyces sp. NPDC093252 TaxID=3154980 RepID=UPI0034491E2F
MPETEPTVAPDTWEYLLHIPSDLRAVTLCRRTVRLILTLHGLIRLVDTAELLAAELVANAVLHTKGPAALGVRRTPRGTVWIGAWDTDPLPPSTPRALGPVEEMEAGRGLGLVRAYADRWGWHPTGRFGADGKYVWCELAAA